VIIKVLLYTRNISRREQNVIDGKLKELKLEKEKPKEKFTYAMNSESKDLALIRQTPVSTHHS
jgi:hypothetical protein